MRQPPIGEERRGWRWPLELVWVEWPETLEATEIWEIECQDVGHTTDVHGSDGHLVMILINPFSGDGFR